MTTVLFAIGGTVAAVLLGLLVLTLAFRSLRIWPTPGPCTWQGYVFWPLFRSLNVLCFAVALADRGNFLGLPVWMRLVASMLLTGSIALFIYSFRVLGRDNSYGAQDGLVSRGVYRWTRNPQNTMLVVVYGCLALAADSGPTYVLCAAMMAVYVLMVLAEEPWLAAAYGEPYRRYCSRVPRFFNWRRAAALARTPGRRQRRRVLAGASGRSGGRSHPQVAVTLEKASRASPRRSNETAILRKVARTGCHPPSDVG
ncbi:MAG TPA: isoprenylcysteine carboxylmethyltransferase family protein [Hyphomicrobiaceae bacterium]|jgi:protein-S-isoprenylcysteine O-methyltransferase Ste14|nr:isoprenylcysteine carboxylmethyltransferase family protein [Hyphomicrobiaceae bacterium]